MAFVVRPEDRVAFKRCRRQWDLGSRSRGNYERADAAVGFDLGVAMRDALAVYYFPGMWEWDRAIVLPLVRQALEKSVERQRGGEDDRARGLRLLEAYVGWAPSVDRFWPVRVEADYSVQVPDPGDASRDLGEIRFEGRVPMLVIDEDDVYWVAEHRVVEGGWTDVDDLLLDEAGISACWAWERFYQGMRVAGTVYTELRADVPLGEVAAPVARRAGPPPAATHRRMYAQSVHEPEPGIFQEGTGAFRRTRIPRTRATLDHAATMLAFEALEMTDPGLRVYPAPSAQHCAPCPYRAPCVAMCEGRDPAPILASDYRERPPEQIEEGRLGGVTWSQSRGAMPMSSRARQHPPA